MNGNRCTGHCCKRFALEQSYSEIQQDFQEWKNGQRPSRIPQIEIIAPMLIPLAASAKHSEYVFTCKNLAPTGDCTIYETRPQMCRDFPTPGGCHFWSCTSSDSAYFGKSLSQKIHLRMKWLRRLLQSK